MIAPGNHWKTLGLTDRRQLGDNPASEMTRPVFGIAMTMCILALRGELYIGVAA
jgi:hypothetical protein